jgi:branched-chain amino acid aminotransferase
MTSFRAFANPAVDRGLHLGDGLFETVLVAAGHAAFLDRHVARLEASCDALGLPRPLDLEDGVRESLPDLWEEEGRPERAALRLTVTRGPWAGLAADERTSPDVYLVLRALGAEPPRPVDAVVLDAPRIDPSSPLAGHKTLSWMAFVEARRRAVAAGAHVGLLRTTGGDVAEADAANVFAVLAGEAVTPPLSRGVLPGITRARVLAALRESGRLAVERPLTDADLAAADEVFLTSSLSGVVGVRRIGGRTLAAPGPWTARIAVAVSPDG